MLDIADDYIGHVELFFSAFLFLVSLFPTKNGLERLGLEVRVGDCMGKRCKGIENLRNQYFKGQEILSCFFKGPTNSLSVNL